MTTEADRLLRLENAVAGLEGLGPRMVTMEKVVIHGNGQDSLMVRVSGLESSMEDVLEFQHSEAAKSTDRWEQILKFLAADDERKKNETVARELAETAREKMEKRRDQRIGWALAILSILLGLLGLLEANRQYHGKFSLQDPPGVLANTNNKPGLAGAELPTPR